MKELAILLRMMQLYSHNAHNNAGGPTFFEDHKFLGKLYPQYEADYDSVVERIIGLYGVAALDLHKVQEQAILMQDTMPALQPDNKIYFATILECEHKLCRHVEQLVTVPGVTEGTKQLLGDLANASESRQYKIKARLR